VIMKTPSLIRILIAALLCFSAAGPLQADERHRERAELARLIHELDFLIQEVNAMGERASPDPRITFDYAALSADLALIRRKIGSHLNGVLRLPNELPPVDGRYSIRGPGGY